MNLAKGQAVRCRNAKNEVKGVVLLASDTNPQSVMVALKEPIGIRYADGSAITSVLALTVDYEHETIADLFGGEWEIDVADERAIRETDAGN